MKISISTSIEGINGATLGHINMTKSELTDLLAVDEVIVTLTLK